MDVHMTPAWVMMLVTALPIITTQELRPTHDVIRRISAEHSKPERALGPADYHYVVEAAVEWSQKHEEDNPTDVQATLTASLQDITTDMGQPSLRRSQVAIRIPAAPWGGLTYLI